MGRETAEQKAERIAAETAEREAAESAAAEQAAKDAAELVDREAAEAAAAEQAATDAEAIAERDAAEAAAAEQAAKDAADATAAAADGDDREIVVATMRINGTILSGTLMAPAAEELAELRDLGAVRDATEDEKAVYRLTNPLVDPDLIV